MEKGSVQKRRIMNKRELALIVWNIGLVLMTLGTDNLTLLSYISLIQLISGVLLFYFHGIKLISIQVCFFLISYFFHMFRIVYCYIITDGQYKLEFWVNSDSIVAQGCKLYIVAAFFFILGIVSTNRSYRLHTLKREISDDSLCQIGWIFLLIGIGPRVAIDIEKIKISMVGGYLASYEVSLAGRGTIATFAYTGVLFLLLAKRKQLFFCRVLALIAILYEGVVMLSGNRFIHISIILCIIYVYCRYVEQFKIKNILLIGVLGTLFITYMDAVREIRLDGIHLSTLSDVFRKQLLDNPIVDMLLEMGGTMNTVLLSIENFPSYAPYGMGRTYLYFIPNLIPKIHWGFDYRYLTYVYQFPAYESLGGSYLGELYYNFGAYSVFFTYLIGKALSVMDRKMSGENRRAIYATAYYLPVILYMLTYIRGYFEAFRIPIYHIIAFLILKELMGNVNVRVICSRGRRWKSYIIQGK